MKAIRYFVAALFVLLTAASSQVAAARAAGDGSATPEVAEGAP